MSSDVGEIISPYDLMAPIYDQMYAGETNGRLDEAAIVAGLCDTFRPNASSILDLGSGTGAVFEQLAKVLQLNEMVGVEQSSKMVQVASEKIPQAEFIQGDITDFDLGREFDVVTCLFDTINHITTGPGWESTFDRAAAHLKPGGILIFDMVTKRLLDGITKLGSYGWKFDGGECLFSMQPISDGQYRGDFKIASDTGAGDVTEISIVETTFDPVPVLRSVKKVLEPQRVFDHGASVKNLNGPMPRVTGQTTRIMIVAQKAA